jgi:acetyl-CoA acetyltransferase
MRDVAVVSFAQSKSVRADPVHNEVEILMPVIAKAVADSGIPPKEIGFTCSGSADYLAGQPFAFVYGLEAIGAWPPVRESHVEADGAWALYEAWVLMQEGEIDSALIYGFGKSSPGSLRDVLTRQLDPYYLAPLWVDSISMAALQARALLESGRYTERDMAEVAIRSRLNAIGNPESQIAKEQTYDEILAEPYIASPLRRSDCAPISDGAAAVVLAAGDVARRSLAVRPAWIRGIDHRVEPHYPGVRDLTTSPSTQKAAEIAGVHRDKVDIAELYAPFTHQELILREALGLGEPNGTGINMSGGALAANPMMAAGLIRIGEAANGIMSEVADRAVAHATSGPCLQQNLVAVLEGE